MSTINMQNFARSVGATITFPVGHVIFKEGDKGDCLYVIQSGKVQMSNHGKPTTLLGANEAIGMLSVIDKGQRVTTATVVETCEVSVLDERKFRFMLDEVPNFSRYVLEELARVIRGLA